MKNTTGLYKHQRDNQGKRRKLPAVEPKSKLVPVKEYEYEKARAAAEATGSFYCEAEGVRQSLKCQRPCDSCWRAFTGDEHT